MMIKTVDIEIIEGLGPLDLVSIFMNQVVKITDEDLVLLCQVAGAEEYQRFTKAAKDFAERLNPKPADTITITGLTETERNCIMKER